MTDRAEDVARGIVREHVYRNFEIGEQHPAEYEPTLHAAIAAALRDAQLQWQRIETAPRGYHELMVRWPNGDKDYCFVLDGVAHDLGEAFKAQPTHFFDVDLIPPPARFRPPIGDDEK